MPTPVPAPDPDELESVAEITMLPIDTVATMVSAPSTQAASDAKWGRTLEDIGVWPAIRDEEGDIAAVGPIKFFEGTGITSRLAFRNRVRVRYEQVPLINELGVLVDQSQSTYAAVTVGSDW